MSTAYGGNPTDLSGTHYGGYGLGVRGALIPSTGLHGPAIPYPGLDLPAENDDEFMCRILTVPGGLTSFVVNEDGSVEADGPDGIYVGSWRGYKNGVAYTPDPSSFTFNIGASGVLSGGATLDGIAASGAAGGGTPSALSGGATLDGLGASGALSQGSPSDLAGGATLDGLAASGALTAGTPSVLGGAATLDGPTVSGGLAGVAIFVPSPARTFIVYPDVQLPAPLTSSTQLSPTYVKDPDATLDYSWQLGPYLADTGDALDTLSIAVAGGAVLEDQLVVGTLITAWLSGVAAGDIGSATLDFTTAAGRTDQRTILLQGAEL